MVSSSYRAWKSTMPKKSAYKPPAIKPRSVSKTSASARKAPQKYYTKPAASKVASYATRPSSSSIGLTSKSYSAGSSYVTRPEVLQEHPVYKFIPGRSRGVTSQGVGGYVVKKQISGQADIPIPQTVNRPTSPALLPIEGGNDPNLREPAAPLELRFITGGPECVFANPPPSYGGGGAGAQPYDGYDYGEYAEAEEPGLLGGLAGWGSGAAETITDGINTNLLILIALIIGLALMLGGGKK